MDALGGPTWAPRSPRRPSAASTIVYAVLQLRGAGSPLWHLAGIVLSSQSLVLKMVDTNGFGAWGTAGFHYVAAAAGPVLWIWLQTLPASVMDPS